MSEELQEQIDALLLRVDDLEQFKNDAEDAETEGDIDTRLENIETDLSTAVEDSKLAVSTVNRVSEQVLKTAAVVSENSGRVAQNSEAITGLAADLVSQPKSNGILKDYVIPGVFIVIGIAVMFRAVAELWS